jgi:hypothetical protein
VPGEAPAARLAGSTAGPGGEASGTAVSSIRLASTASATASPISRGRASGGWARQSSA